MLWPYIRKLPPTLLVVLSAGIFQGTAGFAEDACSGFRAQLPDDIVQEHITVPEDWDHPSGRTIKVFYYYSKKTHFTSEVESVSRLPVVFFNGGPAADSHSSYRVLHPMERSLPVRFIFIDQRGTGCSTLYPQDQNLERLMNYTSRAIVKDAEAIRKKILGDQPWAIFGQSFGGLIVHRYLETAPEKVLDAYAHGYGIPESSFHFRLYRVTSQKRVGDMYLRKYPEDAPKLKKLRSLLTPDLCFDEVGECGASLIEGGSLRLLGFSNSWERLHEYINKMLPGDSLDLDAVKDFARRYAARDNTNRLPAAVIALMEIVPGLATEDDPTGCKRVHQHLRERGESPEDWPFNECGSTEYQLLPRPELAETVPQDKLDVNKIKGTLRQFPNTEFFLYSGAKDTYVPPEMFQQEVSMLGNLVNYFNFPDSGHEGFYTEKKVFSDLIQRVSVVRPDALIVPDGFIEDLPVLTLPEGEDLDIK